MNVTARPNNSESALTALAGRIVQPGDPNWDEARSAWNLAVDQQPALVVFPESPEDAVAALELARAFGLGVTTQGTGHGAAPLGPLTDTVLVKTERMREIEIDPETRIARIDAGVRALELIEAAAHHGLAPLAGTSPDIGIVGYTLGGGLSWFGRKYGLAASNVRAIELVTPDGRLVRADHEREPELFWALRGGGGSFGIVTALELRLVPVSTVYAGILWWPIERDREVLHAFAELTRNDPPDELTAVGRYLRMPPLPDVPEPMRGKSFVAVEVVHLGEPRKADDLLAPLWALDPAMDFVQLIPTPALAHMHLSPSSRSPFSARASSSTASPAKRSTRSSGPRARRRRRRSSPSRSANLAARFAGQAPRTGRSPQSTPSSSFMRSASPPPPTPPHKCKLTSSSRWKPFARGAPSKRCSTSRTPGATRAPFGPRTPTADSCALRRSSTPTT